jgi:hypothetical protein
MLLLFSHPHLDLSDDPPTPLNFFHQNTVRKNFPHACYMPYLYQPFLCCFLNSINFTDCSPVASCLPTASFSQSVFSLGPSKPRSVTHCSNNSMKLSFLEKLIVAQLVKEFPAFYGTRVHKTPALVPVMIQMNPVHKLTPCFFEVFSTIFLPSMPRLSN